MYVYQLNLSHFHDSISSPLILHISYPSIYRMSILTSFCLPIVSILLLSLQASSARPIRVTLDTKDPAQDHKRLLLHHLSDKNGDRTKWVKAKNTDQTPPRENASLSREQLKGGSSAKTNEVDQLSGDYVPDYNKDQEQTAQPGGPLVSNNKDTAKDGKMVKTQVDSTRAVHPSTVSWHLPHQRQRKRRKKKKRGISRDPEFTLDYAPPRVHPPCHN